MAQSKLNDVVFLRFYFYEALNGYLFDSYYGRSGDKTNYREYKIRSLLSYLKISFIPHNFYNLIYALSPLQLIVSFLIVLWRFIYSSFLFLFTKDVILVNKKILFNIGERTSDLLNKTDINPRDLLQIRNPYGDRLIEGVGDIKSIFVGLRYSDIVASFVLSIKTLVLQYVKYHKRDVYCRSYASYDFYLCCHFCCRLSKLNTIYFTSTFARWAFLFSSLECNKVFIQHGIILDKTFTIKIGEIDTGYFINIEQANLCKKLLFKGVNTVKLMGKIPLTEEFYQYAKKNVLLVCCQAYMEQQKKVINEIGRNKKNISLLVKPHPKDDQSLYKLLQRKYDFILIPKGKNPKVDILISYKSTLVDEYMSWNIPALVYNDDNFELKLKELINNN